MASAKEAAAATATHDLKAKIPGWGADLDPKNRPAVPMEKPGASRTPIAYNIPERQVPKVKIFKSTEHRELTPVFGTSCPPKGLSGKIREYAYTLSEGRKSHWLLLLFADRVDVYENALANLLSGKSHNPFSEMGLSTEFRRGGFFSRFGQHRSDVKRQGIELLVVMGVGAGLMLRNRARKAA